MQTHTLQNYLVIAEDESYLAATTFFSGIMKIKPLIKAVNPDIKIILFTSHDLRAEASREPAIDAYLQKRDLNKLLPTVLRLLGLEPVAK